MEAVPAETPASPASSAAIEPSGFAWFLQRPHGVSSTGERVASPIGQVAWAMFDFARIPFVLLITIYVFAPYFANAVVVHDPVRGQAIWGNIQAIAGLVIAVFAPFIGAMSDAGGRRKSWKLDHQIELIHQKAKRDGDRPKSAARLLLWRSAHSNQSRAISSTLPLCPSGTGSSPQTSLFQCDSQQISRMG